MNFEVNKIFYNLIPGGIYFFVWVYLFGGIDYVNRFIEKTGYNFLGNGLILTALFLIIALAIGFFLQLIWRCTKDILNIDQIIATTSGVCCKDQVDDIHTFNAFLWADNRENLSNYFASYAAFWSNNLVGAFITIILAGFADNLITLVSAFVVLSASIFGYYGYKKAEFGAIKRQIKALNDFDFKKALENIERNKK